MEKKHEKYKSCLRERRDRKWKKFKERYKPNLLNVGISKNESTSSFQAMSEKEKTTNRAKELQEFSKLKSVAQKLSCSFVYQAKYNSNSIDNKLSDSDIEIPLNPEISNTHEQSNSITNIGSMEGFVEGKSKEKARRKVQKQKEAEICRKSYAEVVRNTTEKDVDFYRIYENFVKDEKSNSSLIETSPLVMRTNSAHVTNYSCSFVEEKDTLFSTQD